MTLEKEVFGEIEVNKSNFNNLLSEVRQGNIDSLKYLKSFIYEDYYCPQRVYNSYRQGSGKFRKI